MSARRDARAKIPVLERPNAPSSMPAALAIGRCIEVWAETTAETPHSSAKRRFDAARRAWGELIGADRLELQALIPHGAPWSVLVAKSAAERLDQAGCTVADLASLREEASDLYAASFKSASLRRAYQRHSK